MIVLVVIGYSLLVIFETVPLIRKKIWPDFLVNIVMGFLSLAVAVLLSLNVKIPSPVKPIQVLITSIFGK